jgi:hypothetical protein
MHKFNLCDPKCLGSTLTCKCFRGIYTTISLYLSFSPPDDGCINATETCRSEGGPLRAMGHIH